MDRNEIDYMNRYIYQVIRRLPKEQKKEVRMELEELISDMYAEKGSMEKVLMELGDPAEFAKQYLGGQRYLIGPEYYDSYLWVLKVVLICSIASIMILSVISAAGEMSAGNSDNVVSVIVRGIVIGLTDGIQKGLQSAVTAFGMTTLIFALIEHQKIQVDRKKAAKWFPDDLPEGGRTHSGRWMPESLDPVPDQKAVISRSDSIIGIVFTIIFCALLVFAPDLIGAYFKEGDTIRTIPVLNLDQWETILPVFIISLLIGLADEILRLVIGVYSRIVMISNILCGTIQIVLCVVVLKILPVWNPDFALELERVSAEHAGFQAGIFSSWRPDMVSNMLLAIIVVITLLEIGVTIYKTMRYGESA